MGPLSNRNRLENNFMILKLLNYVISEIIDDVIVKKKHNMHNLLYFVTVIDLRSRIYVFRLCSIGQILIFTIQILSPTGSYPLLGIEKAQKQSKNVIRISENFKIL